MGHQAVLRMTRFDLCLWVSDTTKASINTFCQTIVITIRGLPASMIPVPCNPTRARTSAIATCLVDWRLLQNVKTVASA